MKLTAVSLRGTITLVSERQVEIAMGSNASQVNLQNFKILKLSNSEILNFRDSNFGKFRNLKILENSVKLLSLDFWNLGLFEWIIISYE